MPLPVFWKVPFRWRSASAPSRRCPVGFPVLVEGADSPHPQYHLPVSEFCWPPHWHLQNFLMEEVSSPPVPSETNAEKQSLFFVFLYLQTILFHGNPLLFQIHQHVLKDLSSSSICSFARSMMSLDRPSFLEIAKSVALSGTSISRWWVGLKVSRENSQQAFLHTGGGEREEF